MARYTPPAREADAESRWDPLLICAAVYLLAAVGRVHEVVTPLALLHPAILGGVFAIGLYLVDRHEARRTRLVWLPTAKYLVVLVVWMVLSVPGALVIGNSFDLVFNNFLKTVLMVFVMAGAARGRRDVERLALAYLAGATVYSFSVLTQFDLGNDWRLGDLYYYDANDYATLAVTAIPFGLYFLHSGRGTSVRLFSAVALAILGVGFVRAGSRGGFLALIAVCAFIVFRYSAIAFSRRVIATALVALVVLWAASDQFWKQMTTIVSDADYNYTEETGRMQIWSRGVGYMLESPLFGVGPQNFQTAEGTLSAFADRVQMGRGVSWNAAHNSFVQIGAELGIPGLLLLIAILASSIRALWRGSALAQALAASLIGFAVGAFFLSLAYSEMLYALVALGLALQKVERLQVEDASGASELVQAPSANRAHRYQSIPQFRRT
jgi:O-antigen ligase